MDELKKLTQETIYNHFCKEYPAIVKTTKEALANGHKPKDILKYFNRKLGKNSQTANNIFLVAEHLSQLDKP